MIESERLQLAKTSKELVEALGINSPAAKAVLNSDLTINEIVERSNVARSKVSAIKNGALVGISCDLFLKVISAAGSRVKISLHKS